jgi:WD40 repeat protein
MIKAESLKKIFYKKVSDELNEVFEQHGFKYYNSKGQFIKKHGIFYQIVHLRQPNDSIEYNDDTEELFLNFILISEIEIPDYEKWFNENVKDGLQNLFYKAIGESRIPISIMDFNDDDFYEPSTSQKFKNYVSRALGGGENSDFFVDLEKIKTERIPKAISELEKMSNIKTLFESKEHPNSLRHYLLLLYGGMHLDYVKTYFQKNYDREIEEIKKALEISDAAASNGIQELNFLISLAKRLLNMDFINPYARSIKVLQNANEVVHFTEKSSFLEFLRLDVSQFKIAAYAIDKMGNLLLLTNEHLEKKTIFILNWEGKILLEKELQPKKGFDKFWALRTGVIHTTNEFYVNNLIIRNTNEIVELDIPKDKKKKKQMPNIYELVYDNENEKYLVLYNQQFLTYNKNGVLEKDLSLGDKEYRSGNGKIIPEKKWIITQKKDQHLFILNFDGQVIHSFDFSKGNYLSALSQDLRFLICFNYAVKSQFFDLESGKKETVWAHPTFVKDYKEKLYNDTEHNFGLEKVKFSPDNKYFIGGAYHGKYVAWTLPKLERNELIPPLETLQSESNSSNLNSTKEIEIVTLGKETFLKNRRNGLTAIHFLENGDYFLTELNLGKQLMLWNRDFEFLKNFNLRARTALHSNIFFSKINAEELVLYRLS